MAQTNPRDVEESLVIIIVLTGKKSKIAPKPNAFCTVNCFSNEFKPKIRVSAFRHLMTNYKVYDSFCIEVQ